jgi:hypothetical protein
MVSWACRSLTLDNCNLPRARHLSGRRLDHPDDLTDPRLRHRAAGRDRGLWAAVFVATASLWRFGEGQLGNRLIIEAESGTANGGPIQCRPRLGGMLNYYYREAA